MHGQQSHCAREAIGVPGGNIPDGHQKFPFLAAEICRCVEVLRAPGRRSVPGAALPPPAVAVTRRARHARETYRPRPARRDRKAVGATGGVVRGRTRFPATGPPGGPQEGADALGEQAGHRGREPHRRPGGSAGGGAPSSDGRVKTCIRRIRNGRRAATVFPYFAPGRIFR